MSSFDNKNAGSKKKTPPPKKNKKNSDTSTVTLILLFSPSAFISVAVCLLMVFSFIVSSEQARL